MVTRTLDQELAEWLPRLGIEGIPQAWCRPVAPADSSENGEVSALSRLPSGDGDSAPHSAEPAPRSEEPILRSEEPAPRSEEEALDWDALEARALSCTKCRLCQGRNRVVFGVGKRDRPLIAFVGEGPGADENRIGEPFVGRAGELLTAAITQGLGMRREDVYIANVVKCRPPENRTPLPDETASCTPYLYRQLELLNPRVIVALGQPAQKALSGVDMGITRLRGKWQQWRGIPLMPTFHPAYVLRTPAAKRDFWADLQAVMRELDLPLPQRTSAGAE